MHPLSEILHELIAGTRHLSPNRAAELHALADVAVAVLPEPEKMAAEVVADVTAPNVVTTAMKSAEVSAKVSNGTAGA